MLLRLVSLRTVSPAAAALRGASAGGRAWFTTRATSRGVSEARNKHTHTLQEVYAHPTSNKLRWAAVMSMLEACGATHTPSGDGGKEHISLHGRTLFLSRPKHRSSLADAGDVIALRHFLSSVGLAPDVETATAEAARQEAIQASPHTAAATAPAASLDGRHVLVWLSFTEAKVFKTHLPNSQPSAVLHPWDPKGKRQHLHIKHGVKHQSTPVVHGDYTPPDPHFIGAIIAHLRDADEVLLACHGTGKSNAADALEAAMRHAGLKAPVGRLKVSEGHMTVRELMAAARAYYNDRPHVGASTLVSEAQSLQNNPIE